MASFVALSAANIRAMFFSKIIDAPEAKIICLGGQRARLRLSSSYQSG
jgi:hypothetical protein